MNPALSMVLLERMWGAGFLHVSIKKAEVELQLVVTKRDGKKQEHRKQDNEQNKNMEDRNRNMNS